MEQRNLGRSGLTVSAVGLGCNNFGGRIGPEATRAVVHRALDLGITLFDTADVYGERGGSETLLGEILGVHRKKIVLATKFGMAMDNDGKMSGASRRYIFEAVEASLRRLRTDWIDLYQIHRFDPRTPLQETLRALDDLIRQGKVRYVGCSNFAGWQIADAIWTGKAAGFDPLISLQDEYSLLVRGIEAEVLPAGLHFGLGLLPYFPLASGLLTGKYRRDASMPEGSRLTNTQRLADRYLTDRNWDMAERLSEFAAAHGRSLLELAFCWLLARPPVASVIAGATQPEQLEQNVRAASAWSLSRSEMDEIDRITTGAAPQA